MSTVREAIERVISIAENEVGYLEKKTNQNLDNKTENAGSGNYTKYARDLDRLGIYNTPKNGYSWCDIFFDWLLVTAFGVENAMAMSGQRMKGLGAGCGYSANYYKNIGRFYRNNPQRGDQIFFTDGGSGMAHTGLVLGVENGRVYTIEGNTSSSSGVVANGGCVAKKSYSLSYNRIGGYGRPDYSIITDLEEEDMTVERFKELYAEMRNEFQDNDSSTWSEEARNWAVASGLVQGNSNGEFNGMWEDVLTREQMVTILYRFAKMMGK